MGQYYKPINESKEEYLYSHKYDNGLKLMEHSYLGNSFVCAVEALIGPGGPWEGDVVRWEGDYADPQGGAGVNLYSTASESYTEIHPEPLSQSRRYVVNRTQRLYVDTTKQPKDAWGMQIHALPLLICNGNGRGGGDYCGTNLQHVGSWAGDVVTTLDEVPEGYTEQEIFFRESR